MVAFWPALRSALAVARPSQFRVLTYNVFTGPPTPTSLCGALEGSERLRLQAEQIRALAPEVVCLQEVQSDGVRQYFEKTLPEYQAAYVLTDNELRCRIGRVMRHALDSAGAGPQTTISGFLLGPVQSGLMILHRRDTLVADGQPSSITFSEQSGDLLNTVRPRGALCVPLRLRADGSRVVVLNTHTNAESADHVGRTLFGKGLPSVPLPSVPRRKQLTELFAYASRFARDARTIVCGDLNSSPALREIPADQHGFVDVTSATAHKRRHARGGRVYADECATDQTVSGCQPWLATWDGTRNPLVASGWHSEGSDARTQLDYIFTSANSALAPEDVSLALDDAPKPLSDHFGLLASFAVRDFSPSRTAALIPETAAAAAAAARGEESRAQRPRHGLLHPLPISEPQQQQPEWGI